MKNLSTYFGKDNLDEIVFSNRNKAYGAYALRNEYSNDLTKALFVGVAFFASVAVIPLVVSSFEVKIVPKEIPVSDPIILDNVDDPEVVRATPVAVAPPNIKTVVNPEYTPVRDLKKDTPIPTVDDMKGAAFGSETKGGDETTIAYVPPVVTSGPPAVVYTAPVKVENPDKLINQNEADVAADFKGGINVFREKVAQSFDTESMDTSGMISAVITFVVEKDGSISNLKINGSNAEFNSEAERAVKSVKTKWTPAQLKGKAVRSSFRMPISMKIE